MNTTMTTKLTSTSTRKSRKAPRDPRRSREPLSIEELGTYSSSHQIDPWRGQLVQIGWDYCV